MLGKLFSFFGYKPKEKSVAGQSFMEGNCSKARKGNGEPHRDDPIEIWQMFVENVNWQDVYDVRVKFIPRAYGSYAKHDDAILDLLWRRLFRMEQPVMRSGFWASQAGNVIEVENDAAAMSIKAVVSSVNIPFSAPKYVVERCGKLRGFAVSPQLILAGVTAISSFPYAVIAAAEKMKVKLLTREESQVVEENLSRLTDMMGDVGVPLLNRNEWMLQPTQEDVRIGSYETYNLRHPKRFGYLEHDDFSVLLAKL